MSKVLFFGIPSHGHVNPTLGLVSELVKQGEEILYFSSEDFKDKIEAAGAEFIPYQEDMDIFNMKTDNRPQNGAAGPVRPLQRIIASADKIIAGILSQIQGRKFDYIIHSAPFPFIKVIAPLLKLPTVSSHAVFAGLRQFLKEDNTTGHKPFPGMQELMNSYAHVMQNISDTYSVQMPTNFMQLIFNKGDINLVYTSRYFAPDADDFDSSFKFVGPPVSGRKENMDFPFEQLDGKRVIYISLGTVFSNYNEDLYRLFFKSFADMDAVIVMAAYQVNLSQLDIPGNFIVRNYVPQSALLKYTDAAITHAGMNSISDLIFSNTPFVAIPLGADQPLLAKRAEELGATISLDAQNLTPELLKQSIEKVLNDPAYRENIKKISDSFREAGGYPKAVEEIFRFKKEKGII
ncbi:macrolide family glycosyltransferase [Chitinophaga sp. OAE865]|uniref:macrolide family glycosyltransferase n=1 Tax=Chitinophaga sp. OAE865 TaxID=2817898 RepID=UPI001AEB2D29